MKNNDSTKFTITMLKSNHEINIEMGSHRQHTHTHTHTHTKYEYYSKGQNTLTFVSTCNCTANAQHHKQTGTTEQAEKTVHQSKTEAAAGACSSAVVQLPFHVKLVITSMEAAMTCVLWMTPVEFPIIVKMSDPAGAILNMVKWGLLTVSCGKSNKREFLSRDGKVP